MLAAWHRCQTDDLWHGLHAALAKDRDLLGSVSADLAGIATEAIGQIELEIAGGDHATGGDEVSACYSILVLVMSGPNPQPELFMEFFKYGIRQSLEFDFTSEHDLIHAAYFALVAGVPLAGILPAAMDYLKWHMDDPGTCAEIREMFPFVAALIMSLEPGEIDEDVGMALGQFWEWFTSPLDPDIAASVVPWALAEVAAWRMQHGIVTPEELAAAYEVAREFAHGPVYQVLGAFDIAASMAFANVLPEADFAAWIERSRWLAGEDALFREQEIILHRWFFASVGAGELQLAGAGDNPDLLELGTYSAAWLPRVKALKERAVVQ
jgi:hypothetical protein